MSPDFSTFIPESTQDGSSTFFSEEFGEWFHSRQGAVTEAQQTYTTVTQLTTLAHASEIAILDICYGLGYNTAAALEAIWQVNPNCHVTLKALEINLAVPQSAIANHLITQWSPPVQSVLTNLAQQEHPVISATPHLLDAQLLIGDARKTIQTLTAQGWQADVIFLDPFSPPRCPQLWTADFIRQVAQCLKPTGRLATYSCAAAVRSALQLAGLIIRSTPAAGRQWPGTIASHQPLATSPIALNLSAQELEHLKTRAAVPYRDPTLQATASEIQAQRHIEQQQSQLIPTGQWRRRWLPKL